MPNLKSVALTVFELLAFNSHDRSLRTHTQTHIKRTHYLRHSLRSLGGDDEHIFAEAENIIYGLSKPGLCRPTTDSMCLPKPLHYGYVHTILLNTQ